MKLQSLLGREITAAPEWAELEISGLTADSRNVQPGWLFAALPGARKNGADFVPEAIAKGAAAVLVKEGTGLGAPPGIALLSVPEPRRAFALMAARFYRRQPEVAVAVTGTSGKTSVVEFTRQVFTAFGHRAASIGTLGMITPRGAVYGALTTPDPVALHANLAQLADAGVTHLAFEASSHGLDQHRLDGVHLTAAAFTNFGRDHLDYHASLDAYFAAKLRLFTELLQAGRPAVVNADDPSASAIIATARARGLEILTAGYRGRTLRLAEIRPDGLAQRLTVAHGQRIYSLRFPLLGAYQAHNGLLAAAIAIACGEEPAGALAALEAVRGVEGRLEVIGEHQGGLIVVDYAHKPDALAAALETLRPLAAARLMCVFGCGGDRDKGKRPMMGRIAMEKADLVIVTDDNPRSESPAAIRAEILAGANAVRGGAREIGDRAEAIYAGVRMLRAGDVLLIAGKGHERGQIVGSETIPFSDREVALAAMSAEARHG
jgi:UDP-N-acetylmuramoyl-L-alanyl-D-glutamate--2,6-diaminopimelate ligase